MSAKWLPPAKVHTREQEQQQGGDAEAITPLADNDAGEDQYCAKKENVFWCKRHIKMAV